MQLPPLPGKKCQRGTEMGRDEFRAPQGQKQQAEEGERWSRLKRENPGQGHGAEGDKEGHPNPTRAGPGTMCRAVWGAQAINPAPNCGPRQGGMRWEGRGQQRLNCNLMASKITCD